MLIEYMNLKMLLELEDKGSLRVFKILIVQLDQSV